VTVSVVIPWRAGCPHRERALGWVLDRYAQVHPDWQVVTGVHDDGPWCKAAAVADGLDRADGDVLVVADADVWSENLADAVAHLDTAPWVIPHLHVRRLTEEASSDVYAGNPFDTKAPLARRKYRGRAGGGIVVLSAELYDECPLDMRFRNWGQEDDSWALALTAIAGRPWRASTDLWHLWHPPAARQSNSVGSTEGQALFRRYQGAQRKPARMRALVEEGRTWTSVDSST